MSSKACVLFLLAHSSSYIAHIMTVYLNALLASLNARDRVRGPSEFCSTNGGHQLQCVVGINSSGSTSMTAAVMTKPNLSTRLEKVILYYVHLFPCSLLLSVWRDMIWSSMCRPVLSLIFRPIWESHLNSPIPDINTDWNVSQLKHRSRS